MASQEYLEKMQARQNFRNLWHTDLMGTIQADTRCKLLLYLFLIIGSSCDCFFLLVLFWGFVLFVYLLDCTLLCLITCFCFVGVCLQIAALPFGGE